MGLKEINLIPTWIFAIFIVLFVGVLIWERWAYKQLEGDYKSLEFFLDLYLAKYGQLEGMIMVEEEKDAGKK